MAITVNIPGGSVQLTGNPVEIECSGAVTPDNSSEYQILLKVISEDEKLYGAPFTDAKAPTDGEVTFDISGYVDQPVSAKFQWPVTAGMVSYATQAFNVQVQAGEFWIDENGDDQESWGEVSSIIQMLKGGTNPRQISVMNDAGTSFYKMYIEGDKFLTARPQGDQVHPDQYIKLWYMVAEAKATVTYNVKAVFDDGSDETYTSDSFTMGVDYLYEFNCNPTLYGIDIEPDDKTAEYFLFWLDFGSSVTSQIRSFYFDWRPCERPIFTFFKNSLGGIDDVYFSGYISDEFETDGDISEYPYQTSNTVYDPTLVPSGKTGQNKWTFNTGWKTLTTMQYLRDFMLATQVWYLYSNLGQTTFSIIPIIVSSADQTLIDRKENIFSLEIEVVEAHRSAYVFDNRSF
jgi:hypothetical protein